MSYRQGYTELEGQFGTVNATTVSGAANLSTSVGTDELETGAVSGLPLEVSYGPIFAGSPAAGGNSILTGTGATDGGSDAWIVFPSATTFLGAPNIVVTNNNTDVTNTFFVPTGSINVGSFFIESQVASADFTYIAVGSGRI